LPVVKVHPEDFMHRTARLALCCLGFVAACSSAAAPTANNPATTAAEGLDAAQGVNDEAAVLQSVDPRHRRDGDLHRDQQRAKPHGDLDE
jgi:hypothetical protein